MNIRVSWLGRLFATLLILSSSVGRAEAAPKAPRPAMNVLFIVADDLNTDLACYGNKTVKTPHIDRLAARGVRFDRAYCQYPVCNPSRASFLSGLRPESAGVLDNTTAPRAALPNAVFLPQQFRKHGYFVANAGKTFHYVYDDKQSWDISESGNGPKVESLGGLLRPRNGTLPPGVVRVKARSGQDLFWAKLDLPDEKMGDGVIARRVAGWMEESKRRNKPFFLAAGFRKPHLPLNVPRKYFDLYPLDAIAYPEEPPGHVAALPPLARKNATTIAPLPDKERRQMIAAYYASISFMDAQVGVLLDQMDRLKLWDNTVIVFFSDHGFQLGEHDGLWQKMVLFQESARVPLIVCAPGAKAGVAGGLVELIDLYPTLTGLCGLPAPPGLEGASFAPLLAKPDLPGKKAAFAVVQRQNPKTLGRSVHTARWRYTEWGDEGKRGAELYDHDNDPREYANLANQARHAPTVAEMKRLLRENGRAAASPTTPARETTIRVNPEQGRGAISPFVYGSNHRYPNNGTQMWDPERKRSLPAFDRSHRAAGLRAIRYPGGTVGNTFEWKKAIGPVEARPRIQPFSGGGTPTGLFGAPQVVTFGVDEAARWCEANGVAMIYMFGIAFGTPEDAADLVEYLNMPVGRNPNGGTDWARVRADNGHPAPYNIRFFEIANEADGPSQRYWWPFIDSDETRAKKRLPFQQERDSYAPEYLFGGIARFERQGVGARDERGGRDFRDAASTGNGQAGQQKALRYVPIEPGSDTIYVGGEVWRRVPDIKAARGKAYQIEPETGLVRFGDGVHGDIPPAGAEIRVSYRARRRGFVDFYAAMKAVDPTIQIYAGYESHNIVRTLGDKHPYDGVVIHPYTNQYNVPRAATLDDWHHNLMLSSARLGHEVAEYQALIDRTVAPDRRGRVRVICTEFGALSQERVLPEGMGQGYYRFLNIGLYTATQLLDFMRAGVPHADRHATTVGVLGPAPDFALTPTALVYGMFTRHFGDRLVGITVENNPERPTRTAHQPGVGSTGKLIAANETNKATPLALRRLNAEASRDLSGNVFVAVVNQDATEDATADITISGGAAARGPIEIHTLNGDKINAVSAQIRVETRPTGTVGAAALRHTFPAHSLTILKFPGAAR